MSFLKESIKSRSHRKKGFTLIELILVAGIIGIITSIQVVIMCRYMKIHRQEINSSRESFYVNEAFMVIQQQIEDAKYITVKDNKIFIRRCDKKDSDIDKYDYIREDKDSDIIISYGSMYSATTNNILKDIKYFKLKKDRQVLNICIETKKGNVYRRCFILEKEKIEVALY